MVDITDFMETQYGYRPAKMLTVNEFNIWKEENGIEEWDYPLDEYKHIAENDINAVPVRFASTELEYDYRFCEVN